MGLVCNTSAIINLWGGARVFIRQAITVESQSLSTASLALLRKNVLATTVPTPVVYDRVA